MKFSRKSLWEHLRWVSLFLILFFAFLMIVLIPLLVRVSQPDSVPYALHSVLSANYGADPHNLKHAPLRLSIIADVIRDQQAIASSRLSLNEVGSASDSEVPASSTDSYPVINSTPGSGSDNNQNTPVAADLASTQRSDTYSTLQASGTVDSTGIGSTPTLKFTQEPAQTSIINIRTPTPTPNRTGQITPVLTGESPTTKPAVTNAPTQTTSSQQTATLSTSLTAVSPTKTSLPTTKPPTSIAPTPTRTTPPPTSTPIPTQPPPTNTPIPTKPPPTNTPIPTKPPPTNTPVPTKPPDPYPPPPPPPPPPTDIPPYP